MVATAALSMALLFTGPNGAAHEPLLCGGGPEILSTPASITFSVTSDHFAPGSDELTALLEVAGGWSGTVSMAEG